MHRILLVDDDPSIREGLELALRRRGLEARSVSSGEAGIEAMSTFRPDLLLLDLMLPGMNGIQVCRQVRKTSQLPIIMFTGRGDDFDVTIGLDAGADDYIIKPARVEVIAARIRAALRRAESSNSGQPATEFHGELTIDRPMLAVAKSGQRLPLPPSALKLLLYLSASPGQVFSRQQLLAHVWEHSYYGDARLVDACVRRIRNKIEDVPRSPCYIQTVRGFGYRFGPL
ncbi:response regulator transcription factor [Streptomyces sp. H27-H1]|uniref:response regulator transcription factor n=1 Tax=Streptomyces sp. H27-H1 TaxID=2996461 RepID=UPI00226E7649|nr:response regulator transcription factor [Streptomyces sp. H27-H1]MCY0932535.1 response regulator transcription factor [Streptomyces sp. H27-H1]